MQNFSHTMDLFKANTSWKASKETISSNDTVKKVDNLNHLLNIGTRHRPMPKKRAKQAASERKRIRQLRREGKMKKQPLPFKIGREIAQAPAPPVNTRNIYQS